MSARQRTHLVLLLVLDEADGAAVLVLFKERNAVGPIRQRGISRSFRQGRLGGTSTPLRSRRAPAAAHHREYLDGERVDNVLPDPVTEKPASGESPIISIRGLSPGGQCRSDKDDREGKGHNQKKVRRVLGTKRLLLCRYQVEGGAVGSVEVEPPETGGDVAGATEPAVEEVHDLGGEDGRMLEVVTWRVLVVGDIEQLSCGFATSVSG